MFLNDKLLLVNHSDGKFSILDSKNGELIYTKEANGILHSVPVIAENRMYIGDGDAVIDAIAGNMTCYELSINNELIERFSIKVDGEITTPAIIDGDKVLFAASDNYLYCINKDTGIEMMPKKKIKGICRNIIIRNNQLITISDKAQVECFEIS